MERGIKFRAFYDGKWYYQTLEQMLTITLAAFRNGINKTQFTGLKDNQGNDIYEGDILAVDWLDQRYPPKTLNPVCWDEDNACWQLGEGGSPKNDAASYMEIIGNIYESPNLLP
jgi:hypothetical protein